jgi:branched-chain amino acid transport system permease protein
MSGRRLAPSAARLAPFTPPLLVVVVQQVAFPAPAGVVVRGAIVGMLTALIAIGMALVFVPASLAVMLIVFSGFSYVLGLVIGLVAAIALGAVVELAVIRRFFRAPRLILTVATIGLTQVMAGLGLLLPRWWDESAASQRIPPPFDWTFTIEPTVFTANDLIALIVGPLAMLVVGLFLTRTLLGVAVRASAERAERAGLLGIPVQRLHTVVWALAGGLAFVALFLRAGILGIPLGSALSLGVALRAFAALMMGRLTNLPVIALSSVALGVLELAVSFRAESPLLVDPIVAGVIVVSLLLQRRELTRAGQDTTASWREVDEVRPVPAELAGIPEVRLMRIGGGLALGAAAIALPLVLSPDQLFKASAVIVFAIVGVSIVVLTGWAGQVSLGQMAFVGIGAAVSAKLTLTWQVDLLLALVAAGAVGAAVAFVVGIPALRLRNLYLAVVTLGLSVATSSWLLDRRFFDWLPAERVPRLPLFGRLAIDSQGRYYLLSLAVLGLVLVTASGIRRSRTGRVIVAVRDNEAAAQSYGIDHVRARLTAFTVSGAFAGVAGGLFVHLTQAFEPESYRSGDSLVVFTTAVIGGLGSLPGAIIGALYVRGSQWFLGNEWQQLFASSVGVLLVLLIAPGGLGGLLVRVRDAWLRSVARRHAVVAPSLLADTAVRPAESTDELVAAP